MKDHNADFTTGAAAITNDVEPELSEEARKAIAEFDKAWTTMGRRTTDDAYQAGELLTRVSSCVDKKVFTSWVLGRNEITPRHAANLMGVHERFEDRRDEAVRHQIAPTVLFSLISAPDEAVETVFKAYAEGKRLKVREVKALVQEHKGEVREKLEPLDVGGAKGLAALARMKSAEQSAELSAAVKTIIAAIEARLEEAGGKRIKKETLREALVKPSRFARHQLTELIRPLRHMEHWDGNTPGLYHEHLADSRWKRAEAILFKLGGMHEWPGNLALTTWLEEDVLPALRFIANDAPYGEATATLAAKAESEAGAGEVVEAASEAVPEGREPAGTTAHISPEPEEEIAAEDAGAVSTEAPAKAEPATKPKRSRRKLAQAEAQHETETEPAEAKLIEAPALAPAEPEQEFGGQGAETSAPEVAAEAESGSKPKRRRRKAATVEAEANDSVEAEPALAP